MVFKHASLRGNQKESPRQRRRKIQNSTWPNRSRSCCRTCRGRKRKPMADFQPVSTLSALREGQGITVFAAGRNVALFKIDGEVLALDGICPHKGAPLGMGWCEDGVVACPMHGWRFNIRTGDCLDVPDRPATPLPVRVNGQTIEVAL